MSVVSVSYLAPDCNPRIFLIFEISLFFKISLLFALLTFNNFPLSGNTPYAFLPTTERPAIAIDLAESPSVKIRVHSLDFFVPAQLASDNFSTLILPFFLPSVLAKSLFSL